MALALRIAVAAVGGALGGAVAGFVAAVITLQAKRWRNSRLIERGEPGYRDCVLSLDLLRLSALVGFIVAAILGVFLGPTRAILIGALTPAGLLTLLTVGSAVVQAFRD